MTQAFAVLARMLRNVHRRRRERADRHLRRQHAVNVPRPLENPMKATLSSILLAGIVMFHTPALAVVVELATGPNAAAVTPARDAFRNDLGGGTVAGANGSFGGLRREINLDGVPDALSAPNNLPANFFNVNSPRGVVFATPGTGFQVSATAASGTPVEFGNINPTYPDLFQTFSTQRLFTALGCDIVDVNF